MAKKSTGGALERAVKFRFNHFCGLAGAEGNPGEVRELPPDIAEQLAARRGGEIVGDGDGEGAEEEPDGGDGG